MTPQINPVRSIVAVLGATVIVRWLGQALELGLVMALANVDNLEAYFAARNQPTLLAGVVITYVVSGLLAGYVAAKIAGTAEVSHVGLAAIIQVAFSIYESTAGGNPARYPVWVEVALPLTTPPAMIVGALVRAKARMLQETT